MGRVRIEDLGDVCICELDFRGCGIEQVLDVIGEAAPLIRSRPERSVLTLTLVDGARFDRQVIEAMKAFTKGNAPHVRAAAIVGLKGLQRVVLDAVSLFSRREFATFDAVAAARGYLDRFARS